MMMNTTCLTVRSQSIARSAVMILLGILLTFPSMAAPALTTLTIVAPRNTETVHDNRGRLAVSVRLSSGALPAGAGLRALIDGKPVGGVQRTRTLELTGIDRGTHRLEVQLVDGNGEVLATSEAVEFHMWQASRLFRNR